MKYNINIQVFLLLGCFVASMACSKEDELVVPLDKAMQFSEETELDRKIKEIYEKHDIIFHYEWNRNAFARNVIADPVSVEDVLPYIEVFEELYIKALNKVQDAKVKENFVRTQSPLTIFLLGGGLNYGGGEAFGEASSGQAGNIQPNRLTLGGLSHFARIIRTGTKDEFLNYIYEDRKQSIPKEAGEIGFIYHEHNHYLDSKNDIPNGFEKPAFKEYMRGTSGFLFVSPDAAHEKGFMLGYGMQNEHEDFATYVQVMVWKSKADIEKNFLINEATKTKYKMVLAYYKKYGIDLHKLRDYLHSDEVRNRLLQIKKKYETSN